MKWLAGGSPGSGTERWTSEMAAITASSRMTGRIDSSAAPDSVDAQSTLAPFGNRARKLVQLGVVLRS